jgi:protein gp37
MGKDSEIAWCDNTFNPWWGCTKVSPGCVNCYAEALAKRYGHSVWGPGAIRRTFGDKHWNEPLAWNAEAVLFGERKRVFCASMSDVFDAQAPEGVRERLFELIAVTPSLDWQVLTKRPERMADYMAGRDVLPNLWLGTSIESDKYAYRADILRAIPAAVHFISAEPLIGAIPSLDLAGIEWLIIGGESGPHCRPMSVEWVVELADKADAAGTVLFVKQFGGQRTGTQGPIPDHLWTRKAFPA